MSTRRRHCSAVEQAIPATVMRGGTSRALVFHGRDLPTSRTDQDTLFRRALGCPDPYGRQADGLGGTSSSTNKVAVVAPSDDPGVDVDYTFAQLSLDTDKVDRLGNCGNVSAAIGPFAIDERLVEVTEPLTTVRIRNTNTDRVIVSHVPVEDGRFNPHGDHAIAGVPGTGSRILMDFLEPAGALTGSLLPTKQPVDVLSVPRVGDIRVSLVDAANPVVFVSLDDLALDKDIDSATIEGDAPLRNNLESLRAAAATAMGLPAPSNSSGRSLGAVPKLILVDKAAPGTEEDVRVLAMSMGMPHHALQLTGAVCLAAAAATQGTVVWESVPPELQQSTDVALRIAHPAGHMDVRAVVDRSAESPSPACRAVTVDRTARRLMTGTIPLEVAPDSGPR